MPFKVIMSVVFLLLINPIYNIGDVAMATTNAEVKLRYFEEVDLVTLEEAKGRASQLTEDSDFFFQHGPNEDFNNRYWMESDNYTFDIDGTSGFVMNLHRQTPATGGTLTEEEYVERSFQLLQSIGRILFPEEQLHITVTNLESPELQEEDRVKVEISKKLSDGSLTVSDSQRETYFVWEKENLLEFHEQNVLYPSETLRNNNVSDEDIHNIIKEWYETIERPMPAYVLESVFYGYSNRTIDLILYAKTGDRLVIDGKKGELIDFFGRFDAKYEELEKSILQQLSINEQQWRRERMHSAWYWYQKDREESELQYSHSFGYYAGGDFFSYSKQMDLASIPITNTKNAEGKKAIEIVTENLSYTPYATRTKLAHIIDEENNINEGWLVVVRPFGSW